ncbi:chemotaxis protein CheW [Aurantiacibacter gangjinensis]|uniref:Uncharacterized protein n=1 Tax=Aurantiacibacter gangjinensis TaxID=502682 RepID=A0A0G9MLA8_9SPHN|nr:chemotaxis protein CheW [Aurantiacibacter gangjinensis]APE27403.1 hypothetical protein BMF35_a0574 [Aurantiacibacter gangjinensis]KLE31480.1 hypothetical protein AAW01_07845 [Aurantiacibacter gangjinensis]
MNDPILIASLAGRRVALIAREIESIVEIERITPVPRAPDHVEGLSTLRSQALTVINCARVLGEEESSDASSGVRQAAVIKHNGHHYALLLDDVEDVVEARGAPEQVLGGVGKAWTRVAAGVVDTEIGSALLLRVEPFINAEPVTA